MTVCVYTYIYIYICRYRYKYIFIYIYMYIYIYIYKSRQTSAVLFASPSLCKGLPFTKHFHSWGISLHKGFPFRPALFIIVIIILILIVVVVVVVVVIIVIVVIIVVVIKVASSLPACLLWPPNMLRLLQRWDARLYNVETLRLYSIYTFYLYIILKRCVCSSIGTSYERLIKEKEQRVKNKKHKFIWGAHQYGSYQTWANTY